MLHIFHKDFLWSPTIEVFQTRSDDFKSLDYLINNVEEKEKIVSRTLNAIESPSSKFLPYTVFCNEVAIGLFVITKTCNLEYYKSHFCI